MIRRALSAFLAVVAYLKARACERSTYMFITSSMIPLAVVPPPLSYFGTAILVIAALCPNPSKEGCDGPHN
jgi:hypothetical protein